MGGKAGRSGPVGNLHAAKYPWRTFWRRRALKAEDRWILPVLETYASALELDKPNLTAGEARMIEIAQTARGATMLILAEAARSGLVVKGEDGWDLAPGAKELSRFLGIERASLQTLGLGRRAKPVGGSLAELLEAKEDHAST
ncbi:MAG: hypothetical protein LV473_17040 [Nitrospira sp.]|nr:hypothetical protein [Nitrospira sp.]